MSGDRRRQLEAAYRAARYRVELPDGAFELAIGQPSPGLAALYQQHGLSAAAFLTACNPGSVQQPEALNRQANAALQQQLAATGKPVLCGYAIDSERKWPDEASFLVLGLARHQAVELGCKHGQNAILLAGPEAVPELHWLASDAG
jgi:hypothetical protein